MEKKIKKAQPKKLLKSGLAEKLQPMLHEIKESFVVNEKKIEKLVKKAAKFLADGLHITPQKSKKTAKKKSSTKKSADKVKAKQVTINKKIAKKAVVLRKATKKTANKK